MERPRVWFEDEIDRLREILQNCAVEGCTRTPYPVLVAQFPSVTVRLCEPHELRIRGELAYPKCDGCGEVLDECSCVI